MKPEAMSFTGGNDQKVEYPDNAVQSARLHKDDEHRDRCPITLMRDFLEQSSVLPVRWKLTNQPSGTQKRGNYEPHCPPNEGRRPYIRTQCQAISHAY